MELRDLNPAAAGLWASLCLEDGGHCSAFHDPLRPSCRAFPGGTVDNNLPANAGDTGSIPGPGRFHTPRSK